MDDIYIFLFDLNDLIVFNISGKFGENPFTIGWVNKDYVEKGDFLL